MALLVSPAARAASGGTFDLSWDTIDGGGDTNISGGTFAGGVTAGQHDAGVHSGGNFEITGGFWAVYALRAAILSGPAASPNPALIGDVIQFSTAANSPDVVFDWNFGDGSPTARGNAVTHSYGAAAVYSVSVTGSYPSGQTLSGSMSVVVRASATAPGLQILDNTGSPSAGTAGNAVLLAADISNPDNLPLTFTWDFGDGSPPATGNPASHVFNALTDTDFQVKLTVSNGVETKITNLTVSYFTPAPGADGVTNISNGKSAVVNPLNGLSMKVIKSNGGIVELDINVDALVRAAFGVSTTFDGIAGRLGAAIGGTRPTHKFTEPQIAVATAKATELATGIERGKARKTIVVSAKETGKASAVKAPPAKTEIVFRSLKGSFNFGIAGRAIAGRSDFVQVKARIELPEGMEIAQSQAMSVAVGNILDSTSVDAKGKPAAASALGRVKKVRVKYPKLPKGATTTSAGQMADVDITLSMADMTANGFDTEGVSADAKDLDAKGKGQRKIQMALLVAGTAYEAELPATFKLSTKKDTGQLAGRGVR